MRFLIYVSLFFLILTGCAVEPLVIKGGDRAKPEQILLKIYKIERENNYQTQFSLPYFESNFPTPPAQALLNWAENTLKSAPDHSLASDQLVGKLIVIEGSVRESKLQTTQGITDLVKNEQAYRYDGLLKVSFAIINQQGKRVAEINLSSDAFVSVSEGATINDREKAYARLNEQLIAGLDQGFRQAVHQYMPLYVKN